ncbi:MAG: HAD hydrolase-like protein [Candidatus Woesearchaeota archaeon]
MKMKNKIIAIDFSGTLIKPDIAKKANITRFKQLGIPFPNESEHNKMHQTKSHYEIIKEYVEKSFGVGDNMVISYKKPKDKTINLSGKEIKTMIMTDIFRNAMFEVALKQKQNIYSKNAIESIKKLKKKGYKIAIYTGIREDIISGIFNITKTNHLFDFIMAQDPILSQDDNNLLINELSKKGQIKYLIGDKESDISPAKSVGAKAILLKNKDFKENDDFADFTVENFNEIEKIIL